MKAFGNIRMSDVIMQGNSTEKNIFIFCYNISIIYREKILYFDEIITAKRHWIL